MATQHTISPITGELYVERELATKAALSAVLDAAKAAQVEWQRTKLADRARLLSRAVGCFVEDIDTLATELTWQIGRPISQTPAEIRGFEERARALIALAPEALARIEAPPEDGFRRFIAREPLGTVLALAAWNYPYLIAVNIVVPALLAGNTVILKHSDQTPLCSERIGEALAKAGLPRGVYQHIHMSHDLTAEAVQDSRVDYVAFTGSVAGGEAVHRAAGGHLKAVGLELGGKDPAYVRRDADIQATAASLVEGAYFNSGQSCCGIERIYVHEDVYSEFIDVFKELVYQYRLGDPREAATDLGPVVRNRNAETIRAHIEDALHRGAVRLIDEKHFPMAKEGTPYLAPQALINVDHTMQIMREETFGPVVGIMKVCSDAEAIHLMNDSDYGLTASIWTQEKHEAYHIGQQLQTGTIFMNRCDYLDPDLAWVGVKNSGRGCTLSRVGYEQLTRPKSFHFKLS
jgi:acyl-CoA reductase-like NAD-dependent aldehyde dehydrogenase